VRGAWRHEFALATVALRKRGCNSRLRRAYPDKALAGRFVLLDDSGTPASNCSLSPRQRNSHRWQATFTEVDSAGVLTKAQKIGPAMSLLAIERNGCNREEAVGPLTLYKIPGVNSY